MTSQKTVIFPEEESEYFSQQKLARIAALSADGAPHVVPVTYEFDGESLYFSGWNLNKSLKFRNIQQERRIALVIDDIAGTWRPRGVEIRGVAEIVEEPSGLYVKVKPVLKKKLGTPKE
ncbi:MAG: PPOX class F420-dependent oxidoreductase [Nitrososphaerales archaeon]